MSPEPGIDDVPEILNHLDAYIEKYVADVQNPDLPVVHHTRAVYGKGKRACIAEEKGLFEQARSVAFHIVPLTSHDIVARPNAMETSQVGRRGG